MYYASFTIRNTGISKRWWKLLFQSNSDILPIDVQYSKLFNNNKCRIRSSRAETDCGPGSTK